MKRHGNLWGKICDLDNIKYAHQQARKGKAFYQEVKMVDADPDHYAKVIQDLLINKTFTTSQYEEEERFDGRKLRTIYKLPYFPDRIVQHALLNVIGEIITNTFIRDTFQSIKGRGTHDAASRIKKLIRSDNPPKYALKIDIEKYYPSVNNQIMKDIIKKKIKCKDTLWLIDNIIDSMEGLPIGNYTSQHFGNLYLSNIDWKVKQQLKPMGYFRYCDDIVLADNNKQNLLLWKTKIEAWLSALKLKIKPTWNLYNVEKSGVDFVGFVFRPKLTRLRKSIAVNFAAACKSISSVTDTNRSKIMAYKGWAKACNAKKLWRQQTSILRGMFPQQLRSSL